MHIQLHACRYESVAHSIELLAKRSSGSSYYPTRACAARGKVISRGGVYRGVVLFTFAMVMAAILESKIY